MKVVGLTGTLCSGKGVVKEILSKKFNSYYVSLSSIIRSELERKKANFNRNKLQDMGNELRKKYGNGILAKLAIEYLQRNKELIIIDGIRNPGEIEYLRKRFDRDFILIGVDAPRESRFERMVKRAKLSDPKILEEFMKADERDQGKDEPEYGQQTRKCIEKADFVIINDSTIEQLENKMNEIIPVLKQ